VGAKTLNKRLLMRQIKDILRLHFESKFSQAMIARSCGVSRPTVADYIARARTANLSWPLPADLDDRAIEELLFPPLPSKSVKRAAPDCEYIHEQLRIKGVTLSLLWEEYKREHPDGYQSSQFCEIYRRWAKLLDVAMRQDHRAGEKLFSDFAGKTIPYVDVETGEVLQAHLFVSALGASNYTFACAFASETAESWCNGHANAFAYFGGSTEIIIPDNPKATVTKPCRYEADINADFQYMAAYYGAVVIPARVKHPKDKAIVESAVGFATRWITAVLRKHTFFSVAEINIAVRPLVDRLNERPFKKLPGCRKTAFEKIDKPALKPLPPVKFEYASILRTRVAKDHHIQIEDHFYSAPYTLIERLVDVHLTAKTVEIFFHGNRVASHVRSFVEGNTTLDEHRPPAHRKYKGISAENIIAWASDVGPATSSVVQTIIKNARHLELAFRSCMGILNCRKRFGANKLEAACQRAIAIGSYSYKSIEAILKNNMILQPLPAEEIPTQLSIIHEHVRGPNYYAQEEKQC